MEDLLCIQREKFAGDRFVQEGIGAVITEVGEGYAVCVMQVEPRHKNALGIVMGGAIFTLADFAFAVAANQGDRATVSQAVQITFLDTARGNTLTATARAMREGGQTSFYSVLVTDDTGRQVAYATSNGYHVNRHK